jgi:putative SOS response-associated peptidase YedK
MCGRFTLRARLNQILMELGAELAASWEESLEAPPRYNIAPTQMLLALRSEERGRAWCRLQWGLVPSWAKDPKIGASLINARSETVAEKPSFRSAFRRRRCLVPADGFYEWTSSGSGKSKTPLHFTVLDQGLFCFAALWESWRGADGTTLETCSLLTTAANGLLAPYHDRMPVILPRKDLATWLAHDTSADVLQTLLVSYPADAMHVEPVSAWVNNARHEGPECLAPA